MEAFNRIIVILRALNVLIGARKWDQNRRANERILNCEYRIYFAMLPVMRNILHVLILY